MTITIGHDRQCSAMQGDQQGPAAYYADITQAAVILAITAPPFPRERR